MYRAKGDSKIINLYCQMTLYNGIKIKIIKNIVLKIVLKNYAKIRIL